MSEGAFSARLRPPELGRYLIMAVLLPAVLVGLGLWLESEYARMRRTSELGEVIAMRRVAAIDLLATLRKAESEQRGFVITRNPDFLTLYEPSRQLAQRDLEVVLRQTPIARLSPERLRMLQNLIVAKFTEMDIVLDDMRRDRFGAAVARVATGRGRALMIRIEAELQALIASDAALLANSTTANQDRTLRSRRLVWLGVGLFGTLMLGGVILLWHSRRERWRVAVAEADAFARNQAVLDGTSDAIVILNPSGTIENVNAAARTVLGYEPTELSRRDVSVVIDIADGDGSFHERIGLVDGKLRRTLFVDRHARTKDGRKIPVDVALGLMPVPDGLHIIASIRDISHRREIERIKDDFIATVSHELRTPLTSVVGSLGLLRGGAAGSLPASAQQLVEIAENNARRLIRLTNDILDLEKFGSGQMTLTLASTDLVAILRQAAAEIGAAARLKSVSIRLDSSHDACPVMADHQRLLQVATNLLSNAVRHTPEHSIVSISTELADDKAEVRVCDEGPGVPVEYREQVFDRFVQTPDQNGISGTGLGLAIAREIIHRHGGRIWIEDAVSGGACFVFALPCLPDNAPVIVPNDVEPDERLVAPIDARIPTILQIDDDVDLVRVVAASLAGEARVIRANGVASARAVLGLNDPDVIVLDIGLPDGSGADLLPLLVDKDDRPIPTIVFSAQDIPGELRNSEQIKAVLTKSRSTLPVLRAAIRRILSKNIIREEKAREP